VTHRDQMVTASLLITLDKLCLDGRWISGNTTRSRLNRTDVELDSCGMVAALMILVTLKYNCADMACQLACAVLPG
jgi:hypothetical protein